MILFLLQLLADTQIQNNLPPEVNYLIQALPQDSTTKSKILRLDNLLISMPDSVRNDFLKTSVYRYVIDQYQQDIINHDEIDKIYLDDSDPFLNWFVTGIFNEWKDLQTSPYYKLVKENIPVTNSVELAGYTAVKNKYNLFRKLKFPVDEISLLDLKKSFQILELKLLDELLGKISVYLTFIGKESSPNDNLVFFNPKIILPEVVLREPDGDEEPPMPTDDWMDKEYSEPVAANVNTWLDNVEPEPVDPMISSWHEGEVPPVANHRMLPVPTNDWLDSDYLPPPTNEWHDELSRIELARKNTQNSTPPSLAESKVVDMESELEMESIIKATDKKLATDETAKPNRPIYGKDPDSDRIINL